MHWNKTDSRHTPGATRVVCRFAVLPTRMSDDSMVWLDFYFETQVYYRQDNQFVNGFTGIEHTQRIGHWQGGIRSKTK